MPLSSACQLRDAVEDDPIVDPVEFFIAMLPGDGKHPFLIVLYTDNEGDMGYAPLLGEGKNGLPFPGTGIQLRVGLPGFGIMDYIPNPVASPKLSNTAAVFPRV